MTDEYPTLIDYDLEDESITAEPAECDMDYNTALAQMRKDEGIVDAAGELEVITVEEFDEMVADDELFEELGIGLTPDQEHLVDQLHHKIPLDDEDYHMFFG